MLSPKEEQDYNLTTTKKVANILHVYCNQINKSYLIFSYGGINKRRVELKYNS